MQKWKVTYYDERVFNKIMKLPKKLKARYLVLTERMQTYGPNLGLPHTKSLKEGLFEIRVKAEEGIARVFYCTCVNNEIVILHSFIKKTQEIPAKELKAAHKKLNEVKENG